MLYLISLRSDITDDVTKDVTDITEDVTNIFADVSGITVDVTNIVIDVTNITDSSEIISNNSGKWTHRCSGRLKLSLID